MNQGHGSFDKLLWTILIIWQALPLLIPSTVYRGVQDVIHRFPVRRKTFINICILDQFFEPYLPLKLAALFGIGLGVVRSVQSFFPILLGISTFGLLNGLAQHALILAIDGGVKFSRRTLYVVLLFIAVGCLRSLFTQTSLSPLPELHFERFLALLPPELLNRIIVKTPATALEPVNAEALLLFYNIGILTILRSLLARRYVGGIQAPKQVLR